MLPWPGCQRLLSRDHLSDVKLLLYMPIQEGSQLSGTMKASIFLFSYSTMVSQLTSWIKIPAVKDIRSVAFRLRPATGRNCTRTFSVCKSSLGILDYLVGNFITDSRNFPFVKTTVKYMAVSGCIGQHTIEKVNIIFSSSLSYFYPKKLPQSTKPISRSLFALEKAKETTVTF